MSIRYLRLLWLLPLLSQTLVLSGRPVSTEPLPGAAICPQPELLSASQITDSSARLTWTDVGDLYELEIRETAQPLTGNPTHVVNGAPPLVLTGLTPGQLYRFRVRTVCPDSTRSDWSALRSFATDINNARPCPLNFDLRDTSCASGGQFFKIHVDDAPGNTLGGDVSLSGIRLVIEHPWRSDLRVWLWSPDSTRVQLIGGLNAGDKNIGNPEGTPCAQFVELNEQPGALPLSAAAEHDNFTGYYIPFQSLAPFANGQNPNGVWLLEVCDNKTNDKGKLRLFGLVFSSTACPAVANVSVGNITAMSADISWTPGAPGDSILIEYGPAGFFPGTGSTAGIGGTVVALQEPVMQPFTLNGLSTLVQYQVYLRRQCAPGVWGPNSNMAGFFTNCTPTLLENADTLMTCTAGCADPCPLPGLWQNVPDDDYEWKVWTGFGLTYPVAGPPAAPEGTGNYLYFRNSCSPTGANGKKAILRTLCILVDAPTSQPCHFSFDLYMNTKTGLMSSLALQASTDGGQTWLPVKTWSGNRGKQWRREYVDLSPYDGQIALFQLVATGVFGAYGDIAIDNLTFYGSMEAGTPDFEYFRDVDGDGFGDPAQRVILCNPNTPPGYVLNDTDCDDSDATSYPGAVEILCNGKDENCNGPADDSFIAMPAGTGAVICAGLPVTLSASGIPAGQFFWFDSPSGGVPVATGNTLSISNLQTTTTFFLLDSIVATGGGCASTRAAVTATVNPTPALSLVAAPTLCSGGVLNLGALPLTDTAGANGALTYYFAQPLVPGNQLSSPVIVPPATTTYYILSTTAAGCKDTASVTATVFPPPVAQIMQGDSITICRNKTLNLTATATGASPFTYVWSNGLTFQTIPVQASAMPGTTTTYIVTVTDANGCTAVRSIKVYTQNNVTQTTIESVVNPGVCGGIDGSITLHPQNGIPPYTFSWSGASAGTLPGITGSGTITGLKQGGYRITITDASGGCSMTLPQIVLNAPGLTVEVDTIVGVNCPGDATGSISLNVNGVAPVFQWSNNQSTASITNLPGGMYSVTITDGSCTQVVNNLEVTAPTPIQIIQNNLHNVGCFGGNSGLIDLAIFGATPPYQFNWSNSANTEDILNVAAGTYSTTITDANGCTFTSPVYTIAQPAQLLASQNTIQHVKCFGGNSGALSINISGGTMPYQVLWNNGATTAALTGLTAGNYTATVTDANGCTTTFSTTVMQPAALTLDELLKTDPTCIGSNDGRIEAIIGGGVMPYHYSWNTGQSSTGQNILNDQIAGLYGLTVTDAQGCSLVLNNIALDAPQLLSLSLNGITPVACYGDSTGQIDVGVSGGEGMLEVTWNGATGNLPLALAPAGQYILQVRDSRGCAISDTFSIEQPKSPLGVTLIGQQNAACAKEPNGSIDIYTTGGALPYTFAWSNGAVTEDLPAIPAGTFTLTVTDGNGCTYLFGPLTITEPPALIVVPTVTDIPCFGVLTGSITLAVSGGIPPYRYFWNTGDTTQNQYFLQEGAYSVTVLDAIGCAQILNNLTVIDKGKSFSVQTIEVQPVTCPGTDDGKIVVMASNGTPPYQFAWSPPIGVHTNVPVPTDQATALSGGVYAVTITDASGCVAVSEQYLIEESPVILFNVVSQTNVACKGDSTGAILTQLSGGLPPFTFLWNNGATTQNLSHIPAGTYILTVTDFRNCKVVSPAVVISQPALGIIVTLDSIVQDKCGLEQGAIFLHINGGTPPTQYQWNSGQQTASITGLPAGNYQLTVTDIAGCTKTTPVYEIQALASPLQLAGAATDVLCFGQKNGSITVQASGGTPPYGYFWSNAQSGAQLENLPVGNYTLTLTDAVGCFNYYPFTIGQPPVLAATWTVDSVAGGWTVALDISGGTAPYDVVWDAASGNQTGPIATGLATGHYTVSITDDNGCKLVLEVFAGTTGTSQPVVWKGLSIAPNPATGTALLSLETTHTSALDISIYDQLGRQVYDLGVDTRSTVHAVPLDLERLPAGLYFIRIRLESGEAQALRLIKSRQ